MSIINKDREQIVPGNYPMEVVFLDIEKYSLNTTKNQKRIISDFTNNIRNNLKDYYVKGDRGGRDRGGRP